MARRMGASMCTNRTKHQTPLGERRWHLSARCCPRRPRCPLSPPPLARCSCRLYISILSTIHSFQNTSRLSTTSVSRSVDRLMQRPSPLNEMATSTPKSLAGSTQKCGRRTAKCVLAPCLYAAQHARLVYVDVLCAFISVYSPALLACRFSSRTSRAPTVPSSMENVLVLRGSSLSPSS